MSHFNKNWIITVAIMAGSWLNPGVLGMYQSSGLSESVAYKKNYKPEFNEVTSHAIWNSLPEINNEMINQIESLILDIFTNKETQENVLAYISSGKDENQLFDKIENPAIRDALRQFLEDPDFIDYLRKLFASEKVKNDLINFFKDKKALKDMRNLPNPDEIADSLEHLSNNKRLLDLVMDLPKDEKVQKIFVNLASKFGPSINSFNIKKPEVIFDKNGKDFKEKIYDYSHEQSANDQAEINEQDQNQSNKEMNDFETDEKEKDDFDNKDVKEDEVNEEGLGGEYENREDKYGDDEDDSGYIKDVKRDVNDSQHIAETSYDKVDDRQEEPLFSYQKVAPTRHMRNYPNDENEDDTKPAHKPTSKKNQLDKAMEDYLNAGPGHRNPPPKQIYM